MASNDQPATVVGLESDVDERDRLKAELEAELTPEQWHKVRRLAGRAGEVRARETWQHPDRQALALAGHFPAFAPAIRATWQHIVADGVTDVSRCCAAPAGD